jgi:hypothetical protein
MKRLNRDAITALLLLVLCGVLFRTTFDIREVPFSEMGSDVWPRFILIALSILSVIYLFRSVTKPPPVTQAFSWVRWFKAYQNALICFAMFLVFLLLLPYLGMLVAGILFVFITQSIIGGYAPKQLLFHAIVSVLAVGGMWSIFTFALRVVLPVGDLFR